jgi:hypothetical protein
MSAYLSVNESAWNDSDRDFGRVLKEIIGRAPSPAAGGAGAAPAAAAPRSLLNAALNKPPTVDEEDRDHEAAGPVEKIPPGIQLLGIGFSNANANAGLSTVDQLNDAIINKNVKKLSMLLLAGAKITPDFLVVLSYHWMSLLKSENPEFKFYIALMEWLSVKLHEAFRKKIPLPGDGHFLGARNVPKDGMVDAGFFLGLIKNKELVEKYLESESMQLLLQGKYEETELVRSIGRVCRLNWLKFAKVAIVKFLGEVEGADKIRRIRLLDPYMSDCREHESIAALLKGMGAGGGARKRRSTHRVRKNRKGTRSRR